jgi:hypothetical protein
MGCLLVLMAAFVPRIALLFMWIFTNLVDRAFNGFFLPLLGLIFLPYTTVFYCLAYAPVIGVTGWGWVFVILGVFCDLAHWSGSAQQGRARYA